MWGCHRVAARSASRLNRTLNSSSALIDVGSTFNASWRGNRGWRASTPGPAVRLGFIAAGVCAKGPGGQTGGGRTVGASRSYLAHTIRGYWLLMVMESVEEMRATDGGTH